MISVKNTGIGYTNEARNYDHPLLSEIVIWDITLHRKMIFPIP